MDSMQISIPENLKQFVDGQVADGHYASVSEYVRQLIQADQERASESELEALLMEGLASGETPMTSADWADIWQQGQARVHPDAGVEARMR